MKDTITNGSGNSRFLKSNIPSTTTFAQFLAMLNAGTFPFDFNGINSAGVKQMGDALSKANLLTDETAAALGLDPEDNPQVNDALARGAYKIANRFQIGDTLTTIRTDLSENWALCNGATVYRDSGGTNATLYALLRPDVAARDIASPWGTKTGYDVTKANNWWVTRFAAYSDGNGRYICAGLYDPYSGETKVVYRPEVTGADIDFVGIAWDGERYVACYIYDVYLDTAPAFRFYTSTDLENWTLAGEHTPTTPPGTSSYYGTLRFVWDGAAYRAAAQYEGYASHNVYTYDKNFSFLGMNAADYSDIYAADGLFVIGGSGSSQNYVSLFEPGSVTALHTRSIVGDSQYANLVFERYSGDNYVGIPLGSLTQDTLIVYNKSTNKFSSESISDICAVAPYLGRVHIDKTLNEITLVLYPGSIDTTTYLYLAKASLSADLTSAASYTVSQFIPYQQGTPTTMGNLIRDENGELTYIEDQIYRDMTIAGPHPRRLPLITSEEVYTYIKIEEGE